VSTRSSLSARQPWALAHRIGLQYSGSLEVQANPSQLLDPPSPVPLPDHGRKAYQRSDHDEPDEEHEVEARVAEPGRDAISEQDA